MVMCQLSCQFLATPLQVGKSLPTSLHLPRFLKSESFPGASTGVLRCSTETEVSESRNRMFILGMGFVGQFFAQDLKNHGWVVSGTCTSAFKKKKLEERGFNIYLFDANEPELGVLNALKYSTHLLVSIPPVVGIGDPILQHDKFLKSRIMDGDLQWLCYLSSTSVYGNCGGELVDEDYPASPASESAKLRLAAEKGWSSLGSELGLSTQIFRLGGIYGPGRSAVDTIIKQGPLTEGQRKRISRQYTSRVHVADICQALKATIQIPSVGKIYNIVDDDPAPRAQVFAFARDLIEKKWPNHIKESVFPGSARQAEKRVSNARMKKELGVTLLHPTYRSGLQSIIDNMENPISK
ncbi:uncharacterized protein LOC100247218 [Vitis vinifera]|uniref:NAD-dependent epimerase/dehydratase domain-containing protein n=1 Tax=Vitis vinifera TaxID=29760 RepID=E0CQI3_VITVI|eukprot:XP_002281172.1 PREDICTED: uncharacterized protein LOC100247218 isoform X2 [Vitis vinifera]